MRIKETKTADLAFFELTKCRSYTIIGLQLVFVAVTIIWRLRGFTSWLTFLPILAAILLRRDSKESILIIKGMGIQAQQHGHIKLVTDATMFFPKQSIRAVVINEVFEGFRINYVLQIIKADPQQLSLVFPKFRPRLAVLKAVLHEIDLI